MKITASDLKKEGIIDRIIPKFGDVAKDAVPRVSEYLREQITSYLESERRKTSEAIVKERYERFRKM